jgi:CheY-like chemotaxis protein
MILLALFAALHYPVLARVACRQNLRVSGVGCQVSAVNGKSLSSIKYPVSSTKYLKSTIINQKQTGPKDQVFDLEYINALNGYYRRGAMTVKILVADDEQEIRDLLDNFLKDQGYEVILASDGEQALQLAEMENPQAIILDVRMPGLDGLQVCKRLKAKEETKLIPVIFITGFEDNKLEALDMGADDFVNKPFDMVELSTRVKSVLRIRHLTDELERAVAYIEELRKDLPELH